MDNTQGKYENKELADEGAANWANHCGLLEDIGGYGKENGKERPAWQAFVNELK